MVESLIADCTGERLDVFLARKLSRSRSYYKGLIDKSCVMVNSIDVLKVGFILKEGDTISLVIPPAPSYDVRPQDVAFEIIDIQDDFIVINKPAGLVVHPSSTAQANEVTLVHGLMYRFAELSEFEDTERPGIVHRLDKDTSGLLLIARTQESSAIFSAMFQDRKISKTYLAVVSGAPAKAGSIDYDIGRNPVERHKMSHKGIHSRTALTHYKVLAYYDDVASDDTKNGRQQSFNQKRYGALLSVSIVTGRTHQIRVHCAAIGHPVLGDAVYGVPSELIGRQALHAWKLSFEYKSKVFSYACSVPDDFKMLLQSVSQRNN